MTLDGVLDKSTIQFPRLLPRDEAEELIGYIARRLPVRVHYRTQYSRLMNFHDPDTPDKLLIKECAVSVVGDIEMVRNSMAFDTFCMEPSNGDTSKLETMRFQLVPGWELGEYRKDVRALWAYTRRAVNSYFRNHTPPNTTP